MFGVLMGPACLDTIVVAWAAGIIKPRRASHTIYKYRVCRVSRVQDDAQKKASSSEARGALLWNTEPPPGVRGTGSLALKPHVHVQSG